MRRVSQRLVLPGNLLVWVLVSVLALAACSRVPFTGRKRFLLVDEATELEMGAQAYEDVIAESNLSTDLAEAERIRAIGMRVADVTDQGSYEWEFNLIEADSIANAFCLPGGKVAVMMSLNSDAFW